MRSALDSNAFSGHHGPWVPECRNSDILVMFAAALKPISFIAFSCFWVVERLSQPLRVGTRSGPSGRLPARKQAERVFEA